MMLKTVRSPIRNSVKAALQASSETSLTWAHQPRAGVPAASPADKSPLEAGRRCGAPALVAALKDTDQRVRLWSAIALGRIRPSATEAMPALADALGEE